ncbi:DUF3558 domain-containing protein [Amycolatopsis sp. cg13]|uniref:DUF3558 domain-containing protein n=1 Tax=Amycolatopsis sp. cg13 TaxID=3238807 RepID=UPI003525D1E4
MKARMLLVAAGAVAVNALVAACSGGSAPNPTPGSGSASAPSSAAEKTLPYAGAPKVNNPLPVSVLSGHPCDEALTPDQVGRILVQKPQGKHDDEPSLGPQCHWLNSDAGAVATVMYVTKVSDGLSAVYANSKPQSTLWRPLPPIQGFPAVAHSNLSKDTEKEFCQVSVGISDQHDIDVSVTLGQSKAGGPDPCDVTAQVADMVVTNLKQKAGA